MAAKDEEIPKLGSVPPEGEEEVTRVGRPDEIRRALENEGKDPSHVQPRQVDRSHNLPTPPAPPPSAEMKKAVAATVSADMRLAPPPGDLTDPPQNEVPTKPPLAGAVSDLDVDAAFTDTSLDDIPKSSELLDSSFLEPAPPSAKALAPPLPAAARRSAQPPATASAPPTSPPPNGATSGEAVAFPSVSEGLPSNAPAADSMHAAPLPSSAPLAPPASITPASGNGRSFLLVLVVIVAVVGAFALAAMLSAR